MGRSKRYPNIERLQPNSCLAGKVVLSMRLLTPIYKKHFRKHGITLSQWSILSVLTCNGTIAQSDLGRMLALDRSTISRDLKRLIKGGWIYRDGAVNKLDIMITEKGMDYIEGIIPDWENAKEESKQILGIDGEQALDLVLAKIRQYMVDRNK